MDEQEKSSEELLREILERLKHIEDNQQAIFVAPPLLFPIYTPQPYPVYVPYPVPVMPQYPTTVPFPYPHYPTPIITWCENNTSGNVAGYIS